MSLSFTIPKTYATTCKHAAFVCMRHEISYTIHDIYNTHHMTYNTWYLYAHRSPHLLRTCRFTINTVQYLYLSVYICISLHMCTTFWYDVIQCNTMSYIMHIIYTIYIYLFIYTIYYVFRYIQTIICINILHKCSAQKSYT